MADPYDAAVGGGLLGNGFYGFSPLTNFGLGLLSQSGPSLTPQSPWQAVGRAAQFTSEAQQQAMQNALIREKLAQSARETAAAADVQKYIASAKEPLVEGLPNEVLAAGLRADPTAFSKLIPQTLTAADRLQLAQTQAQILKLTQETGSTAGEQISEPAAALSNIKSIAGASERLDEAGSLFQPGGLIEKAGGLDVAAAGLSAAEAAGIGGADTKRLVNQVTDAQTVSKATAALAQMLQGAVGNSSRSAYALRNIQTALGQSMIWPAKRRIMVQNLETIFADAEAQGLEKKIPGYSDAKDLYAKLKAQDEAFTSRNQPSGGQEAVAPQEPAPGGVPGFSMMPAGAEAAPAPAAAPAARPTATLKLDPQGTPIFNRMADLKRAETQGLLKGYTSVMVGGKIYDWVP